MQPVGDSNDEAPEPQEIRQPGPVSSAVQLDRPGHSCPMTGVDATRDNRTHTSIACA